MTNLSHVGDFVTLKDVTNPYIPKNAKLEIISIKDSHLIVCYGGSGYSVNPNNIKRIFKKEEMERKMKEVINFD